MEPITFHPLYMPRIWGGRTLETQLNRPLPDDQPYGESWELVDRPDEQSLATTGPYAGKSLHHLWTHHREEIFGQNLTGERFPLLIKILDACDDLSIQVHPPTHLAAQLSGEPKTEMWYIAHCEPKAKLYVGFKNGVTPEDFAQSLQDGTVAQKVHAIQPSAGDSIFIPSGRLHAIGSGFLIYEIQQNSDTTYRVFDWNRLGLDGSPRQLHIEKSLASIDFQDFEPTMDTPQGDTLATCEYFQVRRKEIPQGQSHTPTHPERFSIITIISGQLTSEKGTTYQPGNFLLLPRNPSPLKAEEDTQILLTTIP